MLITLVFSCIFGTSFVLAWILLCGMLKNRVSAPFIYFSLRCVTVGFIFPLLYMPLKFLVVFLKGGDAYYLLWNLNSQRVILIVAGIWLCGGIVVWIGENSSFIHLMYAIRHHMVAPMDYQKLLKKICVDLKIKRKVRIYSIYWTETPFVYGMVRPAIYLPVRNYTEQELEIIFTHELQHYRQWDVFWKPIFAVLCSLFWFNPLVWYVEKAMKRWAEASCDAFCCERFFTVADYFGTLFELVGEGQNQNMHFTSMWCENKNELQWRVMCMKKHVTRKAKKWSLVVVAVVALLGGGMSAKATDLNMSNMYGKVYEGVLSDGQGNESLDDELVEYTGTLADLDGYTIIQESTRGISLFGTNVPIDWKVTNNMAHVSGSFKKYADTYIDIAVSISPTDKTVKAGIVQPDGTTRYVQGTRLLSHSFKVNTTGYHKVFVSNNSGTTITATGFYVK